MFGTGESSLAINFIICAVLILGVLLQQNRLCPEVANYAYKIFICHFDEGRPRYHIMVKSAISHKLRLSELSVSYLHFDAKR